MANNPNRQACRLCGRHEDLRNSHIIPEFLYKPLYDSQHRVFRLSTGERPKRIFEQKGVRERLLCECCETQLSRYERYARGILVGGEEIGIITDKPAAFAARVDYARFKLFEISILWRAGIASVTEFADVILGDHEQRLRQMLLDEDPGAAQEYGCVLLWPTVHRDVFDQFIMSLGRQEIGNLAVQIFVFGGMCWIFSLASTAIDRNQEMLFLQSDGELRIMRGDHGIGAYVTRLAVDLYNKNPHFFS